MPSATEPPWYAALPESGSGPSLRWTSSAFEAELRGWVEFALDGAELVAFEDVHQRPWSTVWRATTSDGAVHWAKQNCPHQSFEAALLLVLERLSPQRVVPVVAADPRRGLHLAPDQGQVFARTVADDDVDAWCRVAVEAMRLQRDLVGHEAELAGAGVTSLLPSESVAYVEARVEALASLPDDDPRRMAADVAQHLQDLLPQVVGWVEDVEALGMPACLVHNDLHASNVFATPAGMRFFDFGDALVAHPLSVLFVPLHVLLHRFETVPGDPRLRRVADAALEVWGDVVPVTELRSALPSALRLGRLARAESWVRVTATLTAAEGVEYGDAGTWWLGAIGDEPPLP